MKLRSSFEVDMIEPNFVLISDNTNEEGTVSITNDAENVIKWLNGQRILKGKRLFYIDTEGRVDELIHDGVGNFIDFRSGFNTIEEFEQEKMFL